MRLRITATFVGLATLCGSCAVVSSSGFLSSSGGPVRAAGVAYSLPRTVFNVTAGKDLLKITKGAEPDPAGRFLARYAASPFSDDHLLIEVAEDGLLKSVSSTAKDRSADIAINVAQAIFSLGTGGADLPAGRALPSELPKAGFAASYDPLDWNEASRTRIALANFGFCILVGASEVAAGPSVCTSAAPQLFALTRADNPAQYLSGSSGIFYRQAAAVPVQVYRRAATGPWQSIFSGNETMFDKREVYQIDVDRSVFVEKKVDVTFQSGALAKVDITKPSEIYALSTAGLQIVRIVVAIPLQALNVNKALTDAKAANIAAQTTLLQRQAELLKLQVEQQGSTQKPLVRSNVDFVEAGGRALGAAIDVCETRLGASTAGCRAFVQRGRDGF